jgi:hypothetical protein
MYNLSQGIKDKGIAIGEARFILRMYNNGYTAEQIAAAVDMDVVAVIESKEPILV